MVKEIVRTLSVLYIVASTPYVSVLNPIRAPTRDVSVMTHVRTPTRNVSKLTPIRDLVNKCPEIIPTRIVCSLLSRTIEIGEIIRRGLIQKSHSFFDFLINHILNRLITSATRSSSSFLGFRTLPRSPFQAIVIPFWTFVSVGVSANAL